MSELNMEISCDWDLQAIVKGHTKKVNNNNNSNNNNMGMSPNYAWLEDYYQNQDNASLLLDELHQICTPNYIKLYNISSSKNLEGTTRTTVDDEGVVVPICPIDDDVPKETIEDVSYATNTAPKRRKNKNKRNLVIHQETSDRISSDKWNWRKYGEKVIKGSPYPRNYYRCSNSGGCSARKQVELSCTDPGKYLITYIEEHSHGYPSRRPSQAGRTSRRFHACPTVILNKTELLDNISSTMGVLSQPITPKHEDIVECGKDDNPTVVECVTGDEFFEGIEGFELDIMRDLGSYCDPFSYQ